jgi:uncharacterized protein YgiM (DUF1202 family)
MRSHIGRLTLACLLFIVAILACNLPSATPTPDVAASQVAATLTALETTASAPQPASTVTPIPSNTNPPSSTPTPGNPVVIHDALCSQGPGSVYEVVSSVKTGTTVQLIGVGSIPGWYIITNPIYHDPCWIAAANLQIDPAYNLSGLQVYNPPSTPTPKPTDTPAPTDTPVPTT